MPVRLVLLVLFLGMLWTTGCGEGRESMSEDTHAGAFVTLLGTDTLAVESFTRTADAMTADVVLRTPQTNVRHYEIELDETGSLVRYEVEIHDESADTSTVRREVYTPVGDSLRLETTDAAEREIRMIAADGDALPFIDMVHWPFEIMLTRVRQVGADSLTQPLFTARGTMDFVVRQVGEDSMTVTHPFRGTMGVDVDAEGRLQRLDAGETTRKLTVMRVPEVDVDAVARRFAEQDEAGRSFGPLSGRGEAAAEIDGANITVDYGRPSKRGREIFGDLVPWGELWRTGANRATHFRTTRILHLGGTDGLEVPAGEYTLYTIPERNGGMLIVNSQTGQGGTTYDKERDLGRVGMQRSELSETIEDFTISIEDADTGGILKLTWDRTEFSVPFTVE